MSIYVGTYKDLILILNNIDIKQALLKQSALYYFFYQKLLSYED